MILYGKAFWGIPLLFRVYGSALPRAQPFAILAAVECIILREFAGENRAPPRRLVAPPPAARPPTPHWGPPPPPPQPTS